MKKHITPRDESQLNCDIEAGLATGKESTTDTGESIIVTNCGRRFLVELHEIN